MGSLMGSLNQGINQLLEELESHGGGILASSAPLLQWRLYIDINRGELNKKKMVMLPFSY